MTLTTPIDLDAPPPSPAPPPRWRARLPWVVAGVAVAAAALSLAVRLPEPISAMPATGPTPTPTPVAPSIETAGTGWTEDLHVVRGPGGGIEAVVLVVPGWPDGRPVRCRLAVDGAVIEDEALDGHPAVCLWAALP